MLVMLGRRPLRALPRALGNRGQFACDLLGRPSHPVEDHAPDRRLKIRTKLAASSPGLHSPGTRSDMSHASLVAAGLGRWFGLAATELSADA